MAIWSAEIKELEKLYESFKGQLPDLEKELERLIKADDENMILLYSRRCLEVIITILCECELKRDRGTEPLKGIIDKLHKEKKVPTNIITSMDHLNSLSAYGAHPKDFDPEQVKPVLNNLDIIIKWYLKYKNFKVAVKGTPEQRNILEEVRKQERTEVHEKPARTSMRKLLPGGIVVGILLVVVAILAYPKIFKRDRLEDLRSKGKISVAVMPFQNMTNDTTWNVWQDGIQNLLITSLSNSDELKVRQIESINGLLQSKSLTNYASITPSLASSISQQLEANIVICGSINKAGSTIRVITALIDSKTQETFKSFQIENHSSEETVFHIVDSLSVLVNNYLIISKLKKQSIQGIGSLVNTNSPEAYRYYIYGTNALLKRDYPVAVNWLSQSVAIDSSFNLAVTNLSFAYTYLGQYDQAAKLCLMAYKTIDQIPMLQKIYLNWVHAIYFETPYEEIKYLKQFENFDDQNPVTYYFLGNAYYNVYQYKKAIPEFEKALEIYRKWDSKPMWIYNYILPAIACHITWQYKKEKTLYKKAEHDFPGEPLIIKRQAILSFTEKDSISANRYIEEYISVCRNNAEKEASIMDNIASIYSEAGILNKAEEYYRKALSLEPDKPERLNNLSWFLIDKDRNVSEGMDLIDKALQLSPNDFLYVDTKGWGFFKQGKPEEALELLERAWTSRPIYSHIIYLHLEAAKKAVANLK